MKKAIFFLAALVSSVALCAQNPPVSGTVQREPVRKANYALAERFSAKKVNQMVFSTTMRPNWFKSGNRFWYEWKTSAGSRYYIVDPDKGSKTEVFDMEKLAMRITEMVRYPFDAQHIPFRGLKLKEDKTFTFNISGLKEDRDTTHFTYDIASRHGHDAKEVEKYPSWANVSPTELGIYAKNSNSGVWIPQISAKRRKTKRQHAY